MHAAYLVSTWVHVVAAMVWVGGMVFFALVLVPLSRSADFRDRAGALLRISGERFRLVAWICLGLLLVTGVSSLAFRGVTWADLTAPGLMADPWRSLLVHKLGLVVVILVLSAVHDFWVGPKVAALMAAPGQEDRAKRLARGASWFARVNLVLALGVVALAIMLVRG